LPMGEEGTSWQKKALLDTKNNQFFRRKRGGKKKKRAFFPRKGQEDLPRRKKVMRPIPPEPLNGPKEGRNCSGREGKVNKKGGELRQQERNYHPKENGKGSEGKKAARRGKKETTSPGLGGGGEMNQILKGNSPTTRRGGRGKEETCFQSKRSRLRRGKRAELNWRKREKGVRTKGSG